MPKKNLDDAIQLAVQEHSGQKDKNLQPYILHPLRVMLAVSNDYEKMVAIMHDLVEDTTVSIAFLITQEYPTEVVDAIDAMSKRSEETYMQYLVRVKANPIARTVKISDIRDNGSPMRLYMLAPNTIEYLSKKYAKAMKYLLEE